MAHEFDKRFPANPDDYKLYEEVGEGVSATVHRALCIPLNETVAIKVLDLEKCNNDLDGIRREVQTMSLIDHPNVLRAHCSFTSGHYLWIVMPYMDGGSALHIMKFAYPNGFEELVIATLLREVLKALEYLHSEGHIHRDVKAGNILIDGKGAVKLADFGVSACMFDTGDRQRLRNTFVGTPCWMAPEVMQQLHGYDFRADIWSFGITALELAHGHAPFSKYPPIKVLLMTLQNAPPGLDYERDKRFSKSFKEMVAACLVKDPKKRPTAEKLLKHSFFKHGRSSEYLARTILDGLPPLGERYRILKGKEANLILQDKVASEQSQQEYIRGISGWNFNLEDFKTQADLTESSGNGFQSNHVHFSCDVEAHEGVQSPMQDAPKRVNCVGDATSQEDTSQVVRDLDGSFASAFPTRPLEALRACFDICEDDNNGSSPESEGQTNLVYASQQMLKSDCEGTQNSKDRSLERNISTPSNINSHKHQKFFSGSLLPEYILSSYKNSAVAAEREDLRHRNLHERNHSGPLLVSQLKPHAMSHEESSDVPFVQRKGRFQITSADSGQKVAPLSNSTFNSVNAAPRRISRNAASLLPSLQFLLHQNIVQQEELIKLIKFVEQNSGLSKSNLAEFSDTSSISIPPPILSSTAETELQTYIVNLQKSVIKLAEEVQNLREKNSQLEQKVNALLDKKRAGEEKEEL